MKWTEIIVKNSILKQENFLVLVFIRLPFTILINYCMFGKAYFTDSSVCLPVSVVSSLLMVWAWRLHICYDQKVRSRYTDLKLYIVTSLHALISFLTISVIYFLFDYFHVGGYHFESSGYYKGLVAGFCNNLAAIGFHEGAYMFNNWKKTWFEAEELKKNNLKSQLSGLKNQVNPHFLFNSINTLSSLIEEDTEQAERFLNELSKVYRYLLYVEKDHLYSLGRELSFTKSWFYILKTRYGQSIELELAIREEDTGKYLPKLTLQVRIEGAMARNRLSKTEPLKIIILSREEGVLAIGNRLNPKTGFEEKGCDQEMQNLLTKFRLIGLTGVSLTHEDNWRWMEIPLISDHKDPDS